ncbi:hypothetical protein AB0L00_15345 [Actinoallomurus sp. NPDC052308]|uniref:hypothetical protein n=1 Tax=Actinoallomurus sp. NPDC052308 TaxID=3155530 RepID=UPI00342F5F8C
MMLDRHLALEPKHVVLYVRLGLTVVDLATQHSDVPRLADVMVREAVESGDAYAAKEVLAHETCRSYTPVALTETMQGAWLGRRGSRCAPGNLDRLHRRERSDDRHGPRRPGGTLTGRVYRKTVTERDGEYAR